MSLFLSVIMFALNCALAGSYVYDGDWRRALYWAAAAVITVTVTS